MTGTRAPLKIRLLRRIRFGPTCWVWEGSTDGRGYGQIQTEGNRPRRTHIVSYQTFVGPIPDGLTLDHLCRNILCCNPLHLEPVTRAENTRRQLALGHPHSKKTHCRAGHPYTEKGAAGLHRRCRVCVALNNRNYRLRKKELCDAR